MNTVTNLMIPTYVSDIENITPYHYFLKDENNLT